MSSINRIASFLLSLSLASGCLAQLENLQGDWMLTVSHDSERLGVLGFDRVDGEIQVFIDGGPVEFELDGNRLEMDVDYRDGGGRLLSRHFSGSLEGDTFSGTLESVHNGLPGTWRAQPLVIPPPQLPAPVDLSGIWTRISAGMEKVDLDYTPAAQVEVDNYSYLDDPALRCVSPALVRLSGWPYPKEILQDDGQLTILMESFHEVRRIFTDGRELPASFPHTAMGYSIGHWEGSTLVVETALLKPSHVDQPGQPISENARVVERFTLSDDGQNLRSMLTLHDPENYRRPVIRFRQWRKTPDTTILEYDCDSYPFFRGLQLEGRLEEYWERMRQQ